MPNESLITISSRHAVHFERLKAGEAKKFDAFLKQMDKDIRDRLSKLDLTAITRKKLEQQISVIGKLLTGTLDEYHTVWRESIKEAAIYEAGFETRALGQVVEGVSFTLPSDAQLTAAVFSAPLAGIKGPDGGSLLESFYSEFSKTEVRRIEGAIRAGYAQGKTTSQVVRTIRGTRAAGFADGIVATTSRNARVMAHTALQHAAQQARDEVWRANSSVIKKWRFTATLDGKTSVQCQALDGTEYPLGKGPKPPIHLNCFPGDTNVSSTNRIFHVYKRAYKGIFVDIRTATGRSISVTPNHPILTISGWKSAGDINKSDKLACVTEAAFFKGNEKNSINATFSEIFGALNVSADPSRVANRPSATEHFHGDGIADANVEVIDAIGFTGDSIREMLKNGRKNSLLIFGKSIHLPFAGFGSSFPFFNGCLTASGGTVSGRRELGNLFWGGFSHTRKLLFRSVSKLSVSCRKYLPYWLGTAINANMGGYSIDSDSAFVCREDIGNLCVGESDGSVVEWGNSGVSENPDNWAFTDAEQLPDLLRAKAIDSVEFDDVLSISFAECDSLCHVYNLENDVGWYVANGIIAHNCRSTSTGVLADKYAFLSEGRKRASRDTETGKIKYVDAKQSYYDWLRKQPDDFVESVLGSTRTKLLRDGGLSAERFAELQLNKNFTPATLAQMREIEPTAFTKAGL